MSSQLKKRSALGKGLGALLGENIRTTDNVLPVGSVQFIDVDKIEVNPYQPRTEFEQEALNELSLSIKQHGIIQPITLRLLPSGEYQLISGERRLRASKIAGLAQIPAYIRTIDDTALLELGLIENIQREDLNAIEIAITLNRMIEELGIRQDELSDRVHKKRSTISNYLRLLKLPSVIQAGILEEKISMGHAKAILGLLDIDKQLWLFEQILEKDYSVRKTEEIVRNFSTENNQEEKKLDRKPSEQIMKIQDNLGAKFGAKVSININSSGKGKIEIPVLSNDDLNRILELIG